MPFLAGAVLLAASTLTGPRIGAGAGAPPRAWTPEAAKQAQELFFRFSAAVNDAVHGKNLPGAIALGEELVRKDDDPSDRYQLACLYARAGRYDAAVAELRDAIGHAGHDPTFPTHVYLRTDTDLDPLRRRRDFAALLRQADAARWQPQTLAYDSGAANPPAFVRSGRDNPYLTDLRARYNLDALVAGSRGDMERVKILCTWVHTRWNHIGDAKSQPNDPIGLLQAAEKGSNFRCVEYGVTVAGCLSAIGIPARVVGAQAQDVQTRRFGAGHVFAEAYLRDQKHWVFVDPQSNVVGEADGAPLNTVEFRQAMVGPYPRVSYDPVLGSCFYYFTFGMDERYPIGERKKGEALLAPKGAPVPTLFQRRPTSAPVFATHNPADVYGPPADAS